MEPSAPRSSVTAADRKERSHPRTKKSTGQVQKSGGFFCAMNSDLSFPILHEDTERGIINLSAFRMTEDNSSHVESGGTYIHAEKIY